MDNVSLGVKEQSYLSDIFALPLLIRDALISSMIISMIAITIHDEISLASIYLVITIGIGYTLGFAVNDYFDREFDRFDNIKFRKNYFVNHSNLLGMLVLFVSFIFLTIISISYSVKGISVLLVAIFGFWSYSAKPLRFKSRPGYDLVTHGLFIETFPYIITMYLLNLRLETIDIFVIGILLVNSIVNQIRQQLRDYETDITTETNFTISVGKHLAGSIIRILNILLVILVFSGAVFIVKNPVLIPIMIISIPFFISQFIQYINHSNQISHTKSNNLYKLTLTTIFIYLAGILFIGVL